MTKPISATAIAAILLGAQLKEEIERGLDTPEKRERCRRIANALAALQE
ncbi:MULTISPECIES: hypothetical protein [unclassified Thioclava]|nr:MULTISPECIES: hypothetical protein [unclassified Thioclava]